MFGVVDADCTELYVLAGAVASRYRDGFAAHRTLGFFAADEVMCVSCLQRKAVECVVVLERECGGGLQVRVDHPTIRLKIRADIAPKHGGI